MSDRTRFAQSFLEHLEASMPTPEWTPARVVCIGVMPVSDDIIFIETMVSIHTTPSSISISLWDDADAIYVDMPLSPDIREELRLGYEDRIESYEGRGLNAEHDRWVHARIDAIGIDNLESETMAYTSRVELIREGDELRVRLLINAEAAKELREESRAVLGLESFEVFETSALISLDEVSTVVMPAPMKPIQIYPFQPTSTHVNPIRRIRPSDRRRRFAQRRRRRRI